MRGKKDGGIVRTKVSEGMLSWGNLENRKRWKDGKREKEMRRQRK